MTTLYNLCSDVEEKYKDSSIGSKLMEGDDYGYKDFITVNLQGLDERLKLKKDFFPLESIEY